MKTTIKQNKNLTLLKRFSYVLPELKKYSKAINKLDCDRCNGTINEDKYDSKIDSLLMRVKTIADNFNLKVYHQSDPRGCSLYLIDKTMDDSTYNNGIAIV